MKSIKVWSTIFLLIQIIYTQSKKIIKYNESLGYVKKLQISVLQANFIQFLIKQKKFKNCLEIGTFTGYSALSIALSLPSNGRLYAIDKDKKNTDVALNFFKQAKVNRKINVEVNNALVALKNLKKKKKKFDLILIDADKENYIKYFNQSLSLINKDGIILIDNILWKGEVANPLSKDKITMKIKEFNNYIKNKNINKYILPIGDGFFVCWK